MPKKGIGDIQVAGKRVFVRVDFNVPLDESGGISDDTRIRASLPTIQNLIERRARVILASHLGRPKGKVVEEMRLKPVTVRLRELLGSEIRYVPDCVGPGATAAAASLGDGDVALLENLRFHAGEEKNDPDSRVNSPLWRISTSTMPSAQLTARTRPRRALRTICRRSPAC